MIKPILAWCLGIIKATISVFGNNCFSYTPPIKNLTLAHAIIYFGAAYMVYMTLKTISDIREEQAIISRQNQKNEAENNILEIYQ
jgi:threonine/homoserine/homoserine lactone efflux protein